MKTPNFEQLRGHENTPTRGKISLFLSFSSVQSRMMRKNPLFVCFSVETENDLTYSQTDDIVLMFFFTVTYRTHIIRVVRNVDPKVAWIQNIMSGERDFAQLLFQGFFFIPCYIEIMQYFLRTERVWEKLLFSSFWY